MKAFSTHISSGFLTFLLVMVSTFTLADIDSPGGIGAYLRADAEEFPMIEKIIPESPAAGAKLEAGQRITKIDGVSTSGKPMDQVIAMIRGPEMSPVELEILGKDGKTFRRLICRKAIVIPE